MNKQQDYASDTDESDEDFCPNEAGESAVSEEESDGCVNEQAENEEQAGETEAKKKKKKNVRKSSKILTKMKPVKKKKPNGKDEDTDSEDERNKSEDLENNARRSTRQNDETLKNGKPKTLEKDELESDEEDKTRTNALWADFLKDVTPSTTQTTPKKAVNETKVSSSSNGLGHLVKGSAKKLHSPVENEESKKKIKVTEVLDFAGEEVRIEKEIDASSIKENKAVATSAPKMQPFGRIMPGAGIKRTVAASGSSSGSGGLGSILNKIGKKQKISVLDKSQMDWKSFKQQEGIDETLQTYNKGKDGYLERQDFLQRTDLRQFEIEKNLRQSTRRPH